MRDVVIVGGGHNGLVAATLLARAGRSVLVLERAGQVGGAAVSGAPFTGLDARLSRYSYLVSLFPGALARELGLALELRRRPIRSYTPVGSGGLLDDPDTPAAIERLAGRLFNTMTEPLRSRDELRHLLDDDATWEALFERPLADWLEDEFDDDERRGVALTDGLIGTFAAADDSSLRPNRCFLYHVIGGPWDLPVGGMGALSAELLRAARAAGAEIRTHTEVISIESDGALAELHCAEGPSITARHVLSNAAPAVLERLLGREAAGPAPEGAQLKLNMLLARLPRLRDACIHPEDAFAGTFHVNESYTQLNAAHTTATRGEIPEPVPCELYCHSLTDPSILGSGLRAQGVHTLTLFALQMPARLFTGPGHEERKRAAVEATLRSVDSVLAEPLRDCLLRDGEGRPCLEALTPVELERELAMPGGHIFHRDLSWPFAETEDQVGRWGAETDLANIWLCGAGARRGGGVSGIPGYNAARAVLAVAP